jgi:hypothetical protein
MASRNPALPLDSHVQSHAEVLKNSLCEFPRSPRSESDRRWLDSTHCGLSPASAFGYQNKNLRDLGISNVRVAVPAAPSYGTLSTLTPS